MERILANALGQDVTKLAAQEKRMLLSRLLARFAHEIRNPLSSLDIHVQLLEEDLQEATPALREKTAGRFEIIHGELHRLENIVRQFLSLAKPSSLELHPVAVDAIVTHVCELLRPEASARAIAIVDNTEHALPRVMADAAQLTQALMNVVINAIQAVDRKGRIEVATALDTNAQVLIVTVTDSGPGIPAGRESAIFEPFFTTKSAGSGLGLWIVQQIITAHGGDVTVASAQGGGSAFALRLPLSPSECKHG